MTAPEVPNGPLTWMRVVDLTDVRGALCARMLADLGADVVRIARADTTPEVMESTAHRYRNANKRGVTLDLTSQTGRQRLDALLARADVLVENLDPDERTALGLTANELDAAHPTLVHVALTDLGLDGPRAWWHLEALPALAASGALHASGSPHLPPCNAPGYLAHDAASIYGAIGALAGVLDRARHGHGQQVEISTQEAGLAATVPWTMPIPDYLRIDPMLPVEGKRNGDGTYWVLPAKDGFIRTVTGTQRHWDGFVKLLGSADLTGPEWQDRTFRIMNGDVLRLLAQDSLRERTREQVFEQALGLTAVGMMLSAREFVAHPQTQGRGYFANTGFPGLGDAPFARPPVNLSKTPTSLRRPAPGQGDDDASDFWDVPPDAVTKVGPADGLLLSGIRVVEVGVGQVVPELCGVLSELGAEVIKIESLAHPDLLRGAGGGRLNCSFAFNAECRGRKSIALDLTTDEGRELAMSLMATADVVAENQRGGVMDGLGLGYDDVRARNPNVIYASSQGYGRGGPLGEMQAYGPLNAGFAGAHLLWNHPDAPYPCGTTLTYPDGTAGKILALSVLAAIHHRARTGEGQYVEMAQTEAVAYVIGEVYLDAGLTGRDPQPVGNRNPGAAPHGVYPSAGDDTWVAIAVMDDGAWQRLCKATEWDEWAHRSVAERLAAQDEIDARLSEWTTQHFPAVAAEILQGHGVSAMPVMGPVEQLADPHLRERGAIVRLVHPEVGEEHHIGNPIRMSRLEQRVAASAPCLGADTEDVLQSILGLEESAVAALRERGVCR